MIHKNVISVYTNHAVAKIIVLVHIIMFNVITPLQYESTNIIYLKTSVKAVNPGYL